MSEGAKDRTACVAQAEKLQLLHRDRQIRRVDHDRRRPFARDAEQEEKNKQKQNKNRWNKKESVDEKQIAIRKGKRNEPLAHVYTREHVQREPVGTCRYNVNACRLCTRAFVELIVQLTRKSNQQRARERNETIVERVRASVRVCEREKERKQK